MKNGSLFLGLGVGAALAAIAWTARKTQTYKVIKPDPSLWVNP